MQWELLAQGLMVLKTGEIYSSWVFIQDHLSTCNKAGKIFPNYSLYPDGCFICKCSSKDQNHLFFQCAFVYDSFCTWDLDRIPPSIVAWRGQESLVGLILRTTWFVYSTSLLKIERCGYAMRKKSLLVEWNQMKSQRYSLTAGPSKDEHLNAWV